MATPSMTNPWYQDPRYSLYWQSCGRAQVPPPSTQPHHDAQATAYWRWTILIQQFYHILQSVWAQSRLFSQHFRSLALGLQYENEQLHSLLSQLLGANLRDCVVKMSRNNHDSGDHENGDSESEDSPDVTNEDDIAAPSVPTKSDKGAGGKIKQRGKKKSKKSASDEVQLHNDDTEEYDEYLKFAMETERHRKERDAAAAAASGDSHKNNFTPGGCDDYEDIAQEAANIVVDHERLKKEMSDLFGKDALKVRTYITYVA